jgi:hypothetical protein
MGEEHGISLDFMGNQRQQSLTIREIFYERFILMFVIDECKGGFNDILKTDEKQGWLPRQKR